MLQKCIKTPRPAAYPCISPTLLTTRSHEDHDAEGDGRTDVRDGCVRRDRAHARLQPGEGKRRTNRSVLQLCVHFE